MTISRRLIGAAGAEAAQPPLPPPSSKALSLFSATPYTGSGTSQTITTGVDISTVFSSDLWTSPSPINSQSTVGFMPSGLAVSSSGRWVLAGYGGRNQPLVSVSPDGVTWPPTPIEIASASMLFFKIAAIAVSAAGKWVVVGTGSSEQPLFSTSLDGYNWSEPQLIAGYTGYTQIRSLAVSPSGRWIVAGRDQNLNLWCATSTDGSTWSLLDIDANYSGSLVDPSISVGSTGRWILAATRKNNSSFDQAVTATSTDGVNWSPLTAISFNDDFHVSAVAVSSSGQCVIVGFSPSFGNAITTSSTDGVNWATPQNLGYSTFGYNYPRVIAVSATGRYIIAGDGPHYRTSTDGVMWSSSFQLSFSKATVNGMLIAVSASDQWVISGYNSTNQAITTTAKLTRGLVWIKKQNATLDHKLYDTTRASQFLSSNTTAGQLSSADFTFEPNGFSVSPALDINTSGEKYISWSFRESVGFFDIVTYAGVGFVQTISHSLYTEPELIIVKSTSTASDWSVYCKPLGTTKTLKLNSSAAAVTSSAWKDNALSNATFGVGVDLNVNADNVEYVAYLFATDPGISAVGSYTGNGSTRLIACGFDSGARFIMIKRTDAAGDWFIWDRGRGIVSARDPHLSANTGVAEVTTDDSVDPAISGFIVNQNTATNVNVTGGTYIYLSIA